MSDISKKFVKPHKFIIRAKESAGAKGKNFSFLKNFQVTPYIIPEIPRKATKYTKFSKPRKNPATGKNFKSSLPIA